MKISASKVDEHHFIPHAIPNTTMYETIIIGRGLMGSAAAAHLSAETDNIALIGPDEPQNRYGHDGVFGSHYDEGRITRMLDPNPVWTKLAQRAIQRYRDLEARSGQPFFGEVGHLYICDAVSTDDEAIAIQQNSTAVGAVYETLADTDLQRRFPYLGCLEGAVGMFQVEQAGHVSPRRLVAAQTNVAEQQGAHIIRETVTHVEPRHEAIRVKTAAGNQYEAKQILLATGGFSNCHALLPHKLEIRVKASTVLLAELDSETASQLATMPSLICSRPSIGLDIYMLPPIRYPDGKQYLKLGGGLTNHALDSLDALKQWYQSRGNPDDAAYLKTTLARLMPHLKPISYHTDSCVVSDTAHGYVYADRLPSDPRIGLLIGGCGQSAKSAAEIGFMGAQMMRHDNWQYDIDHDYFRAKFVS